LHITPDRAEAEVEVEAGTPEAEIRRGDGYQPAGYSYPEFRIP